MALVKLFTVGLYGQDVGAVAAHDQAIVFAAENNVTLMWEKTDVKNFFDTLERIFGDELIVQLLDRIRFAGHFVAIDVKEPPNSRKILNRVFVATHQRQLFQPLGASPR